MESETFSPKFSSVNIHKQNCEQRKQTKKVETTYPRGDSPAHPEDRFEWYLNLLGSSRAAPEAVKAGPSSQEFFFPGE